MIRVVRLLMLLVFVSIQSIGLVSSVMAADKISDLATVSTNGFELIPQVDKKTVTDTYNTLAKSNSGNRHQFWDKYNETAKNLAEDPKNGVAKQLAT
jgi:hypothetical protein